MGGILKYRMVYVDRIVPPLDAQTVYISEQFEVAALLCPCGCGHQINLLLGDGHRIEDRDGKPSISPSIGVWDSPCRSHFWIRNGEVAWAEEWSDDRINRAMINQTLRHSALETKHMPVFLRWTLKIRKFFGLK